MLAKEVNEELSSSTSSSSVASVFASSVGKQPDKMLSFAPNLLHEGIYRRVENIARLH
jgi:hypothetical protein